MILTFRNGDRTLGIAPLIQNADRISFLGDTDLFDYHDFLVPIGQEEEFFRQLDHYLSSVNWHCLELSSLPEASPTLKHLPALAEKRGFEVNVVKEDVAPAMDLPISWEEFIMSLSKKNRHELRRKLRKLEDSTSSNQIVYKEPHAIKESIPDFFRLLKASSADKAAFMTQEREQFFTDIAEELSQLNQIQLSFLEIDHVRVASCMNLLYASSSLLYNSGYDPNYSELSIGILNKALVVKDAIDAGLKTFDFLRGAERYKYSFGARDQTIYHMTIRR